MNKTQSYVRAKNRGIIWITYYVPLVMSAAFFALGAAEYVKGEINAACFSLGAVFAAVSLVCFALHFPYKKSDRIDYGHNEQPPRFYALSRVLFHALRAAILAAAAAICYGAAISGTILWIGVGAGGGSILILSASLWVVSAARKKKEIEDEKGK